MIDGEGRKQLCGALGCGEGGFGYDDEYEDSIVHYGAVIETGQTEEFVYVV